MKGFEERLTRLEEISEKIRDNDVPLDEAVTLFEQGVKLARTLERDLAKVERRVQILVNEPDTEGEEPILELFPELNTIAEQNETS
ncbi:MAG: exodeoxyribonuclease VII small subunit [Spirochaetaceae bacterium]|nr:MAG: exodeoxyribonuclease VII small subunit [Spirochaetaceae bacterium]